MNNSEHWIQHLQLDEHPEGGFYRRIYQSDALIDTKNGKRHSATAIHYLLQCGDFSAWHRIQQDELWFYQQGCPLVIRSINHQGELLETVLGKAHNLTTCIPANTWFCSEPLNDQDDFSLVSCVVTPGFDFADFEMANKDELVNLYPQHRDIICRLCRE